MKAVIFVLTALLAVAGKAHAECGKVPQYSEKIDPVECPLSGIQLPNYENATVYYQCSKATTTSKSTATLTGCPTNTYFNYAMQKCVTCDAYFPSTQCSSLKINVTCVSIATTVAPTAAPTVTPTVAPTVAPTETTVAPTTKAPGTTVPVPPTDAPTTTTTVSDDIITPTGTTISVPQPPSPNDSNVPTPVTPAPTAPVINDTPPTAAVADTD
ncbi:peritrophin-55 [Drosophila yakuba]|uniref:Chitin-binding type-2 domain-containing protein n=1 Tax=Drosophila yakuba TaxID=7245 RepID=B4PM11_DROYA|nr:peritrophin-55 [Drosophila yakuba]EDW95943.1 uncharacterized protein Dyak_GE25177 [Drosophila yakuba]